MIGTRLRHNPLYGADLDMEQWLTYCRKRIGVLPDHFEAVIEAGRDRGMTLDEIIAAHQANEATAQ